MDGNNTLTFGGGNNAGATTTNVTCNGTTIATAVFGGSNSNGTVTTSNVTVESGTIPKVFGGNNQGGTTQTSHVNIKGGTITDVFGGGDKAPTGTTYVATNGGTITSLYGGGNEATATTTYVEVNLGTITNVYGGGNKALVTTSNVELKGGNVTLAYGGGNEAGVTTTNITCKGSTISNSMFGGSNTSGTVNESNVEITSGSCITIYGGNNVGGSTTTSNVTITSGTVTDVYGGGYQAPTGTTNVTIDGTVNNNVYGGGNLADCNVVYLDVNGEVKNDVYGGGNQAGVDTNTNVNLTGATINNNAYGGGNQGVVNGNTYVVVKNTTIDESLFAGGNGVNAVVEGNTNLVMEGTTNHIEKNVFGGGNSAATGTQEDNNSTSTVNIVGGYIGGNVYGGANTSVIYGEANVNIGYDAVGDNSLTKGNIEIIGTVFGGGEANAEGSQTFDFDAISVTSGINILIDGNGHSSLTMTGSIFGSGNASSSAGDSIIVIKNYGTINDPQRNISIQRANAVTIINSAISLTGTKDRTNEFKDEIYTLSRIDNLKLKNGSTLYLAAGANLLQELGSYVDDPQEGEVKGEVTIDPNTGSTSKNVDNRIYLLEGVKLNVATNQNATTYGKVQGMFFLGLYTGKNNPSGTTGMYDENYENGDTITNAGTFTTNSYVKAEHMSNHDIEADGFYTNYKDENDNTKIRVNYVGVTPDDDVFYIWLVGEEVDVTVFPVTLTASKYATLGTYELLLDGFSAANAKYLVVGFTPELNQGISLVEPSTIASIETNQTRANSVFGLGMTSGNVGWATNGETTFLTTNGGKFEGTKRYNKDNSNYTPTLNLCFYHSQNLTDVQDLGESTIRIQVSTPSNVSIYDDISYIDIVITMKTALYQDDFYEAAITPGQQFGLFTSTDTTITDKSAFSAYYSLYISNVSQAANNKYADYEHFKRVIVSRDSAENPYYFPENTKITMLDLATNKYYYYIVTSSDVSNHKYEYAIADFIAMGTTNDIFNETAANNTYYDDDPTQDMIYENFIFQINFADTTGMTDMVGNTLLMELRNATNQTIVSVLGIQRDVMKYNVYTGRDATIQLSGNLNPATLYLGNVLNLNVSTQFTQQIINSRAVFDTQYFDQKLGIKISIYDNGGHRLNIDSLFGVYFELDGQIYYPRIDGTTRINIADKVTDVLARLKMHTENNTIIATGDYTIRVESFGSSDGIYYGLTASDMIELPLRIINSAYGLKVTTDDEYKIVNKDTGFTENGDNIFISTVEYTSALTDPKVTVSLYRRKYTGVYDQSYELVDLSDYMTHDMNEDTRTNEYLYTDDPQRTSTHEMELKEGLTTGTYKLVYKLYDDDTYVGEAYEYIVIK